MFDLRTTVKSPKSVVFDGTAIVINSIVLTNDPPPCTPLVDEAHAAPSPTEVEPVSPKSTAFPVDCISI